MDTPYFLENYIYIYQLEKFCILPSVPDQISDRLGSRFADTNALARTAPVQSYIQSGPRTVNFQFDLHRDIMDDLNTGISNLKDNVLLNDVEDKNDYVDLLLNYLQAMVLPRYNVYKTGSKVVDPPQVAVRMGNDIFIRGVIAGDISVTYQKPILDNGKYARVQVGFTVTEVDPYDAPTVAMRGGFRGVTATFKNGIYKGEEDNLAYSGQEYTYNVATDDQTTIKTTPNNETPSKGSSNSVTPRGTYEEALADDASSGTIRGLSPYGERDTIDSGVYSGGIGGLGRLGNLTLTQKVVPGNNKLVIPTFGSGESTHVLKRQGTWGSDTSKKSKNNLGKGWNGSKVGNY